MLELHFFADQHKLWHDPVVLLQITMCSHAYWWCLPNQGMSLALSRTELSFFTWQKENATGQETPSVSCGWRAAHWVKVDGYKNCTNGMWFFFLLALFFIPPLCSSENWWHETHGLPGDTAAASGEAPKPQAAGLPFPLPLLSGFSQGDSPTGAEMRQLYYLLINSLSWSHSRRIKVQISTFFKPQVTSDLRSMLPPPAME